MIVLNVGGGSSRNLPSEFDGWEQKLLDVDPAVNPDICLDARALVTLEAESFDAIYCSHVLEHFYRHDVPQVLGGMRHVLKPDGFAQLFVPDLQQAFRRMRECSLDVTDVWYRTGQGYPITFHDVLYGWDMAMAEGNLYYAHKCGFTETSLKAAIFAAGFQTAAIGGDGMNIRGIAYKGLPCR